MNREKLLKQLHDVLVRNGKIIFSFENIGLGTIRDVFCLERINEFTDGVELCSENTILSVKLNNEILFDDCEEEWMIKNGETNLFLSFI